MLPVCTEKANRIFLISTSRLALHSDRPRSCWTACQSMTEKKRFVTIGVNQPNAIGESEHLSVNTGLASVSMDSPHSLASRDRNPASPESSPCLSRPPRPEATFRVRTMAILRSGISSGVICRILNVCICLGSLLPLSYWQSVATSRFAPEVTQSVMAGTKMCEDPPRRNMLSKDSPSERVQV